MHLKNVPTCFSEICIQTLQQMLGLVSAMHAWSHPSFAITLLTSCHVCMGPNSHGSILRTWDTCIPSVLGPMCGYDHLRHMRTLAYVMVL